MLDGISSFVDGAFAQSSSNIKSKFTRLTEGASINVFYDKTNKIVRFHYIGSINTLKEPDDPLTKRTEYEYWVDPPKLIITEVIVKTEKEIKSIKYAVNNDNNLNKLSLHILAKTLKEIEKKIKSSVPNDRLKKQVDTQIKKLAEIDKLVNTDKIANTEKIIQIEYKYPEVTYK